MSALPLGRSANEESLRVLGGRRRRRSVMAPWMIVAAVAVVGFLGLGFARTSLDTTAFELSELEGSIEQQQALNEQLKLEVARLENPARIAPLAEKLGMVIAPDTDQILVDLTPEGPRVASADTDEETQ